MQIKVTESQMRILKSLLEDFETGYIANPSRTAERQRIRYEKCIREIITPMVECTLDGGEKVTMPQLAENEENKLAQEYNLSAPGTRY